MRRLRKRQGEERGLRAFLFSWDRELWRLARLLASLLNPLRNASLFVALVLALIEAGQPEAWPLFLGDLLVNLVALLIITWLVGEVSVALIVTINEWRQVLLRLSPFTACDRRRPTHRHIRQLVAGSGNTSH